MLSLTPLSWLGMVPPPRPSCQLLVSHCPLIAEVQSLVWLLPLSVFVHVATPPHPSRPPTTSSSSGDSVAGEGGGGPLVGG